MRTASRTPPLTPPSASSTTRASGWCPRARASTIWRTGTIDKGKSTGFGKPAGTLGATASKMLDERTTLNFDVSNLWFQEYTYYADPAHGDERFTGQFGDGLRVNAAVIYKLYTNAEQRFRLDGLVELN